MSRQGSLRRRGTFLVLGLLVSGLVGCSGSDRTRPEAPPQASSSIPDVGSVAVTVVGAAAADAARLDQMDARAVLRRAVEKQLGPRLREGSPRALTIEITDFRIRLGATAALLGIMAGVDSVDATVRVEENGRTVKSFETGAASAGGLMAFSSASRYAIVADRLAVYVSRGL